MKHPYRWFASAVAAVATFMAAPSAEAGHPYRYGSCGSGVTVRYHHPVSSYRYSSRHCDSRRIYGHPVYRKRYHYVRPCNPPIYRHHRYCPPRPVICPPNPCVPSYRHGGITFSGTWRL